MQHKLLILKRWLWAKTGNADAQRIADATELGFDLLSGRVPVGSVPQAGSALNRTVDLSGYLNAGIISQSPVDVYISTMQVIQTGQNAANAMP